MIIGHFMPGTWDMGGISNYLQRVGRAQRQAGHTVQFLDDSGRDYPECDPEDRPIVVAPADLADRGRALGLDVLHMHNGVGLIPDGGFRVVRTLHEHRPYCPSGGRYLKRTGAPCDRVYSLGGCLFGHVVDRCGSIRPEQLAGNFAATWRERSTLPGTALIAISDYVKRQMVRSGFDGTTIHVVHNPSLPVRPYQPPPRDGVPRLLFMGRLAVQKGLQWALRAMAAAGRPLALDVAGEGPQRAEMERLARDLGLADAVAFHGWVDNDRLDSLAAAARAVVFPAVWHEPAGLACMDGSARGRAVIGSRSGGLPEYAVAGENALVVEPNDVPGLSAAMARLVDDWDLAARLGQTGRAMAAGPFSLDRHVTALDRIYRGRA